MDHIRDLRMNLQLFSSISNHKFRGINSLSGLHKMLTDKNKRYENRTAESNNLKQGRQKNLYFEQDIKDTGINSGDGNNRLKKSSNGTKNKNILGAIKNAEIIDKMVKQSKIFYKNVRSNRQDLQVQQQEQLIKEIALLNVNDDSQNKQKQALQSFQFYKTSFMHVVSKECFQCSKTLDTVIVKYICSPIYQSNLVQELNLVLRHCKAFPRFNFFHMFLNILTVKLEESNTKKISVLQLHKAKLQKDYYLLCVDSQKKLASYVNIRCRKLIKIENYTLSSFLLDPSLSFWCKSFMMFLTGLQNFGQKLIQDLNSNGFSAFASAVECFYAKQPILQIKQLKSSPLYGEKIFYRIFLKVLLQQKFDEEQNNQVNQEEKQLITLLKLYHLDFYYRTIQFTGLKEKLYSKLLQDFQNNKISEANKTMENIIGMLCLDQMYFQVFFSHQNQKQLSYLQRLLILRIFLQSKHLLAHTRIDRDEWVLEMISIVEHLVLNTNQANFNQMNKIAISYLKIYRQQIASKQYQNLVVKILASNKIFIQNLVNTKADTNYLKIITYDLCLPLSIIDQVTFQSLKRHKNYFHFINIYLAKYMCVVRILEKDLKKPCNSFNQMRTIYFQNHKQNQQSGPIQVRDQIKELRQKNHIFQLGLICMNQFIFQILRSKQRIDSDQSQQKIGQNQKIVRRVKQFAQKIKTSLTQNLTESLANQQLMVSSREKDRKAELQRFLTEISSLLEINDFTTNIIYLHHNLSSQDVKYLGMCNEWLVNMNKKGQKIKVSMHSIVQNMKKYKIIDDKDHIWLLNEQFKQLMLLFKNRNLNRSRKRDPHSMSINVGLFVNLMADCMQTIQNSSVESEVKIEAEQRDYFLKSIIR